MLTRPSSRWPSLLVLPSLIVVSDPSHLRVVDETDTQDDSILVALMITSVVPPVFASHRY